MLFTLMVMGVTGEEVLYGYGPLGVFVVALAYIGLKMFNIILADRDKAIKDRDSLLEDFFTKVLPAITKNTEVLETRQTLDRDLIETLKESNKLREETRIAFDRSERTHLEQVRAFESFGRLILERGGPNAGGN